MASVVVLINYNYSESLSAEYVEENGRSQLQFDKRIEQLVLLPMSSATMQVLHLDFPFFACDACIPGAYTVIIMVVHRC